MPNYDFRTLSPIDFEDLSRDLLQKRLHLNLESFARGRDNGIDLKFANYSDIGNLIVQCKHYVDSGFNVLLHKIKAEKKNLDKLLPARYILVTSVALTPANKEKLLEVLTPYSLSTGDIYGAGELNGMLLEFPEVERKNFKLWLTSVEILQLIVNAKIRNYSSETLDEMKVSYQRFVQIPTYQVAIDALENYGHCMITGVPGVGKTTLAHVLLADYLQHEFEVICVTGGFSEVWSMLDKANSKKQIFFYDDFLGDTALALKVDGEQSALFRQIISFLKQNKNAKLILTTREYIFESAKQISEKIYKLDKDLVKCVVSLGEFSSVAKAKILYNHLYFSDLEDEKIQYLVEKRAYRQIVTHPNFNPRIVETFVNGKSFNDLSPQDYVDQIYWMLDHPAEIWEHPFQHQIGVAGQYILYLLFSLGGVCLTQSLRTVFEKFAKEHLYQNGLYSFENTLRILDGTFVHTYQHGMRHNTLVRFHNPSIKDYITSKLTANEDVASQIIRSATFIDQLFLFFSFRANDQSLPFRQLILNEVNKRPELPFNLSSYLQPFATDATRYIAFASSFFYYSRIEVEGICMALALKSEAELHLTQEEIQAIAKSVRDSDCSEPTILLSFLAEVMGRIGNDQIPAAKIDLIQTQIKERVIYFFNAHVHPYAGAIVADLAMEYPDLFDDGDREVLAQSAVEILENLDMHDFDEPSEVESYLDLCSMLENTFGINTHGIESALEERKNNLEQDVEEEEQRSPRITSSVPLAEGKLFDLDGFFEKLIVDN